MSGCSPCSVRRRVGQVRELGALGLAVALAGTVSGAARGRRRGIDLRAHRIDLGHEVAFGLPAFVQLGQFVGGALSLVRQFVAPGGVIGARRRLALDDLQLGVDQAEAALAVVDRRRYGVLAHRHAGAGGVDQADGLVRQLAGRDVARRQAHGVAHRLVEDANLVMQLEGGDEAADHGGGHFLARLLDLHGLEAAGEGRVLLEVLLVFGPGGRSDRPQFAARQGGLQEIGRIVLAGLAAGADQRVRLVDEKDDGLGARLGLLDHRFQAVLEFTLHARAGLQQAKIECAQCDVAQCRRHVAGRYARARGPRRRRSCPRPLRP